MPSGNRESLAPVIPGVNRWLPLLSVLVLASACGHAAGSGGGAGGAPGHGPGPVQPGPPRAVRIRAASLHAGVAASGPYARIGWWGMIPSCQGVAFAVGRHGTDIVVILTPKNVAPPDTACPEIAMLRKTTGQPGIASVGQLHGARRRAAGAARRRVGSAGRREPVQPRRQPERADLLRVGRRRTPHPARRRQEPPPERCDPWSQRAGRAPAGGRPGSRCGASSGSRGRRSRRPGRHARRSSSAAVIAPIPRAPGMPSEGSPRSAMKSGTCSGLTP